jgi:hypothetical protein
MSRPCPAMIPFSPSTKMGLVHPNSHDRGRNLSDLRLCVSAGVAGVRNERGDRAILDGQFFARNQLMRAERKQSRLRGN